MIFRFHPAENIQETEKYHSLEFVHCSDWLFQPNFGRFLIRTKLDFGRYFLLICKSTENLDSQNDRPIRKSLSFGRFSASVHAALHSEIFKSQIELELPNNCLLIKNRPAQHMWSPPMSFLAISNKVCIVFPIQTYQMVTSEIIGLQL